jgi:hypothetical protein
VNEEALVLARRHRVVRYQARTAARGVLLAVLVIGVTLSGAIPMAAGTQGMLLTLAVTLGLMRLLRGLWAARVARHLMVGWTARRLPPTPARRLLPAPTEDANARAVRVLTDIPDEPLADTVRAHGLKMAGRMAALKGVLADSDLASSLRRPVAEELAHLEGELESLLGALGELARADRRQRQDLLSQLTARLELDRPLPAGLYAPAT